MGCSASASQPTERLPSNPDILRSTSGTRKVEGVEEIRFFQANLVRENMNQILKEYSILSPPLGRGSFGEVRKAIHKPSGMYRAIKIISIKASGPEEFNRIQREVKIVKQLVGYFQGRTTLI